MEVRQEVEQELQKVVNLVVEREATEVHLAQVERNAIELALQAAETVELLTHALRESARSRRLHLSAHSEQRTHTHTTIQSLHCVTTLHWINWIYSREYSHVGIF